jgi:hypothetical protein
MALLYWTLARGHSTALFLRWGLPVRAWGVGADRHVSLVPQLPGFIPAHRKAVILQLLRHAATAIAIACLPFHP